MSPTSREPPRDTLTHSIDVGGVPVLLIDTAGLRETEDSIETLGIARTMKAISDSDLVLNVVDRSLPTREALDTEVSVVRLWFSIRCDLPWFRFLENADATLKVSALTGKGLEDLRAAILSHQPRP